MWSMYKRMHSSQIYTHSCKNDIIKALWVFKMPTYIVQTLNGFCTFLILPVRMWVIISLRVRSFLWGDLDQDQRSKICPDHGAGTTNPLWPWIHQFLWCTRSRQSYLLKCMNLSWEIESWSLLDQWVLVLSSNLLLIKGKSHTGECWLDVVAIQTECSDVSTKTTEVQYPPVRHEQARLAYSLLYGTLIWNYRLSKTKKWWLLLFLI